MSPSPNARLFEVKPYSSVDLELDQDAEQMLSEIGTEVTDRIAEYARGFARDGGYQWVQPPHIAMAKAYDAGLHRRAALRSSAGQVVATLILGGGISALPFLTFAKDSTPWQILLAMVITLIGAVGTAFFVGRNSAP